MPGCLTVIIGFGLFAMDSAFYTAFGLWVLALIAFELLVACLILYFADPFGY